MYIFVRSDPSDRVKRLDLADLLMNSMVPGGDIVKVDVDVVALDNALARSEFC